MIILLGAFPRTDIPVANIALRHSIDRGSKAIVIDTHHREYNHHVESKKIVPPSKFVSELKKILKNLNSDGQNNQDKITSLIISEIPNILFGSGGIIPIGVSYDVNQ